MRLPAFFALLVFAVSSAFAAEPRGGDTAPVLAVQDVRGRALVAPVPGHVTLLSFASTSTGEAVGEIARALRVEHPELEILSFIDVSGYPGFTHGLVRRQIAKRQADAVEATRAAFVRAGKTPPDDLDARIHIIPDFDGRYFASYGASGDVNQPRMVLIGADGRIRATFAKPPLLADVKAAVANEAGGDPPR